MQLEMIRGGTIILLDTVDRPISNWIIRISAVVVRGVVSIVQWLLLRRSVEKSFKKISFHAYKLRANGYNKDEGEEKMRERFPDCLPVSCVRECMRLRRELFVSRGCVLSYTILFLVQVRWTRVVPIKLASWIESPLGSRVTSRDNFGQSPVPLVIFWLEKGVKYLSSYTFRIAEYRKFRDQIHPRFEARYYFSVYDER